MQEREFYLAARDAMEYMQQQYLAGRVLLTRDSLAEQLGERSHLVLSVLDWWKSCGALDEEPGSGGYCYRIHPDLLVAAAQLRAEAAATPDGKAAKPAAKSRQRRDAPSAEQRERFAQAVAAIGAGQNVVRYQQWFRTNNVKGIRTATLSILASESRGASKKRGNRGRKTGK